MTPRPTRDEKPLNVQVAEALGATVEWRAPNWDPAGGERWMRKLSRDEYFRQGPDSNSVMRVGAADVWSDRFPPYGEDSPEGWACTGPLAEKYAYRLQVCEAFKTPAQYSQSDGHLICESEEYPRVIEADSKDDDDDRCEVAYGANIPQAIANLILALAEAGKL